MCVSMHVIHLVKLPMLRHIPRSDLYLKQVIARSSHLQSVHASKMRTERVYHKVNGESRVETSGRRRRLGLRDSHL